MFSLNPVAFDTQTADLNRFNQRVNQLGWLKQPRPVAEHPVLHAVSTLGHHFARKAHGMGSRPKTTAGIGRAVGSSSL